MPKRSGRESLDSIAVFVTVSRCSSFTEAARELGLSASAVSKSISRLETRLDTRLIDRTTRRLSLTAEGRSYFESCRRIMSDLESAEAALAEARSVPRGLLRVQVPRGFGRKVVIPALVEFLDANPEMSVEVTVRDGAIDPGEEGVDISFVLGNPSEGQFIARHVTDIGYAVCASPDYLARHGYPVVPSDLATHRCLNYLHPRTGRTRDWTLVTDGQNVAVPVASVFTGNDIQAVHQAALSGAGVAYLMDFLIADDVKAGRLVILMQDTVLRNVPVHVCYPRSPYQSPRVTAFVEFVRERFSKTHSWSVEQLVKSD
ncbi:MAG: LysR family transcriptional regulator [Alphaproteobacteria bacterium]